MYEAAVYGDTTFMEFTDGFLTEHVKSVSVCDTEMVSKDRQVYFNTIRIYWSYSFPLSIKYLMSN